MNTHHHWLGAPDLSTLNVLISMTILYVFYNITSILKKKIFKIKYYLFITGNIFLHFLTKNKLNILT